MKSRALDRQKTALGPQGHRTKGYPALPAHTARTVFAPLHRNAVRRRLRELVRHVFSVNRQALSRCLL